MYLYKEVYSATGGYNRYVQQYQCEYRDLIVVRGQGEPVGRTCECRDRKEMEVGGIEPLDSRILHRERSQREVKWI